MKKSSAANLLLLLSTLFLLALLGEVFLILRWDILGGGFKRSHYPDWIAPDSELMWVPKAQVSYRYDQKDVLGNTYAIDYQTGPYGFRVWGDLKSERKKIFVIGDSNTHALEVSNDKTYYSILGEKLGAEIFAFGVNGYNTVQQWIVLKRYLPVIQPDLILWQFNANDLACNDCRHPQTVGFIHNPGRKLLCWDVFKSQIGSYPQNHFWLWLTRVKMVTPSRLIYWVATRFLSVWIRQEPVPQQQKSISQDRLNHGKEATLELFKRLRVDSAGIPFYLFSNDESPFYDETLRQIAAANDFYYMKGLKGRFEELTARDEKLYAADQYHWSEKGHAAVANFLVEYLRSNGSHFPEGTSHEKAGAHLNRDFGSFHELAGVAGSSK